ncbi:MAG TPA: non-homologous end-joining DNA ligase [Acidimicrobiia bacterium]|nr:non-homologous end-joining DNA ligase [Acidimicrobiia bacterium]
MLTFGISGMPPDGEEHEAFLDRLVAKGHGAFELGFTGGFPWKEKHCARFGELAAERGIRLSAHAPYFASLTVTDEDRSKQTVAAIEHTMKLGAELGASIICAHPGSKGEHTSEELMDMIRRRLDWIGSKVAGLGVSLGLETAGNDRGFGTLGDIAVLAGEYPFVRPIVDWAHVHAMTGGGLTSVDAFAAVLGFVSDSFAAVKISPLQCQFSDNIFGPHGEIRHTAYGEGTLRITPLVAAAVAADMAMVIISESRDAESHDAIGEELRTAVDSGPAPRGVPVSSRLAMAPATVRVEKTADRWKVIGSPRPLTLSNIDKPYFPDGITKGDLVQYYASVADLLLPHLAGRPLSMSRYPDGIDGPSFYEKRAPGHQPEWMETGTVRSDSMGGDIEFLLADSRQALMWFANMGCIEMHPFHSRIGRLEHPDLAIFDLDPADGSTWDQVVTTAGMVRTVLGQLDLQGFPKLSGSRGLHVYVPLEAVHTHERVRRFVGAVGELLAAANPDDVTLAWDIPKRKGKVFIDHNRNAFGQTIASVYSARPRPGAPVSVPLRWDEVGEIRNGDFTIDNVWDRLRTVGDLFARVLDTPQTLDAAEERLGITVEGGPTRSGSST